VVLVSLWAKLLPIPKNVAAIGKTGRRTGHKQGMTTQPLREAHSCAGTGPPIDVVAWRRCRLVEAGFPPALAARLAANRTVDVHALLQLVDRGCPHELAARILSPLTDP
jgi:hypothetical protein